MQKPDVKAFINNTKQTLSKHSPEILTAIGIAGMFTTTVLAVKATPKALELIEQKKKEERTDELTPVEVVKTCWKPYIPAVITGITSTACLIGANSVNAKRNAALATAYKVTETALSEYKDKVIETIGEKKERTIREKVAQKKVDDNPASKNEIFLVDKGSVLFLDPVSRRYFTSDIELIKKVVNDLNYRMISGMEEYISLSEFYDEIGLTRTSLSDDIGWNLHEDGQISIELLAAKTDEGLPCLMLEYGIRPRYDYAGYN